MMTTGVAEGSEDALLPLGLNLLSGDYPQKEDQCLISDVQYSLFEKYGFVGADGHLYRASEITNPSSFVDLSPKIDARIGQNTYRLAITGIVKTGFDRMSYDISDANSLSYATSKSILSEESVYSPYSLLFVSPTVIASNFNAQTNYVPFCDFQVCLFDSLNTGVRSLRRIDYAGASTACFSNDGSAVPLKLFGAIYGGGLLKLEGIEKKDYVSCLSFYSDFGELGEENRYLDSTFLFADYLAAKASNLSLLAAGNYVSKNGLPQGEAYASFVSFAKEQYTVAAKYLKKEVPDFDAGDSKTQGYLKSLYVWYLSTPELHPTAEGGFNIQEGGYVHNAFDDVTGLQITKEFMESVFEKEGFSGKEAKLDFAKSARDGDCIQRTVRVSGVNLVNDNVMHIPSSLLDDLKHFLGDAGSIRFLLAKNTHNKGDISRYVSGLDTDFGHYLLSAPAKTSYEYFGQRVFQNFSLLTSLVGGAFSFLSVALLALMLKTVSAERSKEMALRRCLGESKKDVFFALFSQSFAFGIVGFAVSLVASSVFVASLNALFLKGVPTSLKFFSLNAWGVLICLGLILVCCAASSFFSALKGAKQSLAMNLSRNS